MLPGAFVLIVTGLRPISFIKSVFSAKLLIILKIFVDCLITMLSKLSGVALDSFRSGFLCWPFSAACFSAVVVKASSSIVFDFNAFRIAASSFGNAIIYLS